MVTAVSAQWAGVRAGEERAVGSRVALRAASLAECSEVGLGEVVASGVAPGDVLVEGLGMEAGAEMVG